MAGPALLSAAMTTPRTRFAPSPTGYLHIGGARTALFNWAFTRHHGGEFVLRIEDTDRQRSTPELERAIVDGLTWLGIDWDVGPIRQSERRDRHDEVVEELLAKRRAYRCTCSREELEERRQASVARGQKWVYDGRCRELDHGADCGSHTVRLRLPPAGRIAWDDGVFGPSGQDAREIGDMIIRRSDGLPLYHLAVVVDDADMQISHVIRGADHLINTPFQLALYAALDRTPPAFAHVPLIVSDQGKKLSKRQDDVSIQQYEEQGLLAAAVRNWLVRIGWSYGDKEIFSGEEIVELFSLASVSRSSGQADRAKLLWLNQQYIKALPRDELLRALAPYLEKTVGHAVEPSEDLADLLDLLRERSKTLVEMASLAKFLVTEPVAYDEKAASKHLKPEQAPLLAALAERLGGLEEWSSEALEHAFHEVLAAHDGLSVGKLAQPVRVAVTGSAASPPIYDTLRVLGRTRALARLAAAIEHAQSG